MFTLATATHWFSLLEDIDDNDQDDDEWEHEDDGNDETDMTWLHGDTMIMWSVRSGDSESVGGETSDSVSDLIEQSNPLK